MGAMVVGGRVLPHWRAPDGDVFLLRLMEWDIEENRLGPGPCVANVPHDVELFAGQAYGWGERSKGSAALAADVLHAFLSPRPGEKLVWRGRWLATDPMLYWLVVPFADAFLAHVPRWGGRLVGACVRDWISSALQLYDPDEGVHLGAVTLDDAFPLDDA